jgi:hypothetical protein
VKQPDPKPTLASFEHEAKTFIKIGRLMTELSPAAQLRAVQFMTAQFGAPVAKEPS